MADEPRQAMGIILHQVYIRRLDRRVAANRAHGDAQTGACHCRRVIDAVSDHGDAAVLCDQPFDRFDLLFGKQFSVNLIDAGFARDGVRSEEHTSELQSLMRISYAVFCLKKKKKKACTTQTSNNYNFHT